MSEFPIPKPERLPVLLRQCPIVDANMEVRFITNEPWSNLPGLLSSQIKERYKRQTRLPLDHIPEDFRRSKPEFTYQPLIRFESEDFLLQFGPRVFAICTRRNQYPGWQHFVDEMKWILEKVQAAGFVEEPERLGLRYINFFKHQDLFSWLRLQTMVAETPVKDTELSTSMILKKPPFTTRLVVTNRAFVKDKDKTPTMGSVLDIDVWLGANDFELFDGEMRQIFEAHTLEKEIFFGLLKPDFLATLDPQY